MRPGTAEGPLRLAGARRAARGPAGSGRAHARRRRGARQPVRHPVGGRLPRVQHSVAGVAAAGRTEGHRGQGRPADGLVAPPPHRGPVRLRRRRRGPPAGAARPADHPARRGRPDGVGRCRLRGAAAQAGERHQPGHGVDAVEGRPRPQATCPRCGPGAGGLARAAGDVGGHPGAPGVAGPRHPGDRPEAAAHPARAVACPWCGRSAHSRRDRQGTAGGRCRGAADGGIPAVARR